MSKVDELELKLKEYANFISNKVSWNSNIQLMRWKNVKPSGLDYVYFIIAPSPNLLIKKYLSPDGTEIHELVLKDKALFSSWGFNGIYVFDPRSEETMVVESPILPDNYYLTDYLISQIDHSINLKLSSGIAMSNYNFDGDKQTFTSPENFCDCGAKILGYKKEDDFAHSRWCKVFKS